MKQECVLHQKPQYSLYVKNVMLINGTGEKYCDNHCDNQNIPFKDKILSSLNKLSDKEWEVLEKIYKEIN